MKIEISKQQSFLNRDAGKQIVFFVVFLLYVTVFADAQPNCKIEYYSTGNGLSHQRVTTIIKDQEGFMWFGSWDGINRFDGHTFVSYKSSAGDSSPLSSGRIDQIVEGEGSYLWVHAYNNEIYLFDKKKEQFLSLSNLLSTNGKNRIIFNKILAATGGLLWLQSVGEGIFCISQFDLSYGHFTQYKKGAGADYDLPSDSINFFHEDSNHHIWIGTPHGLRCLVRSPSGVYKNDKITITGIAEGAEITAFEEDNINLYFSTAAGNLIQYEKKSKVFAMRKITKERLNAILRSKKSELIYATTAAGSLVTHSFKDGKNITVNYDPEESLHNLFEDSNGVLWIEPEKKGVLQFDPATRSFRLFSQENEEGLYYIGNRFRILEDKNGIVWVNMKGGGFGYYNSAKGTVEYLINTPAAVNYQLPNIIYTIYYDKSGILWLTTYERELVKIILQGNDFKHRPLVEEGTRMSENEARGIFNDDKNRLWLGAKSGKLYVYQNNIRVRDLFDNEPPQGLGGVYSILKDTRGNIWLGTKGNGLYKASPINGEGTKYHLSHFLMNKRDSSSLQCNEIYALLEDKLGRIWIGSFDNGLALVANDGDSVKFINTGNAFRNYPGKSFRRIRHMSLDKEGNIWMGTTDGLLILDPREHQSPFYRYVSYSKIPGKIESLGNNDIQFVLRDSKNIMWLATSGGGFCRAAGMEPFQSLAFRNYTTSDGLPNDFVLSCVEDKRRNIWIATENGLSRFNPENEVFRNYDSYDGLPKTGFSEASVCRQLPDGQLVFGTTKGYLFFNPEQISANRIAANLVLTNLQINNADAGPGMNETVLKEDINYVSKLLLKYNQNIISIDYAILDHRSGNRPEFAYRLLGFDSTWHNDRQQRQATYTNLSSGHYVFEVKTLSADLYSNTPFRRLDVTILPPPWKTWWAYLLYAVFTSAMLFFIWRYAVAMIRLRHKISVEQKLATLKLNFFTNISHELRTPLTLIVNPLELVARKGELSPEIASYVDVARKNADRMVRFINQLLDLRKVQSEKATLRVSQAEIVSFVKKISDHFAEAARSKKISLDISSAKEQMMAWVDAEKLDVIIYNLLGNAIKFTPEGKAIRLLICDIPEDNSFSIAVYDQGPGVRQEELEEIFELFHQSDDYNQRSLKGTGIGLALSREFVNLHGGKIWAANNEDGGLTVTVKLKTGSGHFKHDEVSFIDSPKAQDVFEKTMEQQLLSPPLKTTSTNDQQIPLVLLVEDNDELRVFLHGQLTEFYRVETAGDGEEGWQKASNLIPDLIISDIMMPKMDGITMLDKVKNEVNTSHIPVVLLTAKYAIESQMEGLKYGADYYITKPFNIGFLMASVNNLLSQRKKLFELLVEKKKAVALSPSDLVITSKDDIFLKEVVRVVECKMADVDFNIETVAETIAMSRTTFHKKFKSLTGVKPVEFVRDMRLQRSKQLLDAGGNNISEIAYLVGFNNPKYYSTCFKEKYHISPSDYLKARVS